MVTWTAHDPSKGVREALAADCVNGDARANAVRSGFSVEAGMLEIQWDLLNLSIRNNFFLISKYYAK